MENENPAPLVGSGNRAGIVTEQHSVDNPPVSTAQDWRDLIKVHDAANEFEMMSDAELDALREDIVAHGLRVRLVFLGDQLIDGRNRVAAIWRIRNERWRDRLMKRVLERDQSFCVVLPDDTNPSAYVVSANILRRHLDREQKRELIKKLIKADPEKSDRQIAAMVKGSPTTVGTARREMEAIGEVSKLDTRIGADGVKQPIRKLSPHSREITRERLEQIRAEAPKEANTPSPVEQIADRKDALRALDETIRLLEQRSAEVLALPRHVRLARAMRVLDALGIYNDRLVVAGDDGSPIRVNVVNYANAVTIEHEPLISAPQKQLGSLPPNGKVGDG